MGRGRENTSFTLSYKLSPLLFDVWIGESVASRGSMADGHTRSSSCDSSVSSSAGYIEHTVSRFDTLAGIAIKYGVEVADVKRMNGLLTDLQMFALKTLKIPLPGRHPPSSPNSLGFASKQSTARRGKHPSPAGALKDSSSNRVQEKRPITSAMGLLRGYYGLSNSTTRNSEEGMEMAVYKSDSDYQSEDEPFSPQNRVQEASGIRSLHDNHRLQDAECRMSFDSFRGEGRSENDRLMKSKYCEPLSKSSGSTPLRPEISSGDSGGTGDVERGSERPVRRRGKAEGGSTIFTVPTLEAVTPDLEKSSRITVPLGKSSVLRPKIITRVPDFDEEMSTPPRPVVGSPTNGLYTNNDTPGTVSVAARALSSTLLSGKTVEGFISKIRRSTSVPSIQDDRRSYKGDSSTLFMMGPAGSTQGGVISSVLEGFPGAVRRNKAALD